MFTGVEGLVQEMSLEEKIGQMLHLAVLEDENNWPSREMKRAIREFKPAAVRIYSKRGGPFFRAHYTDALQRWSEETRLGIPLIVAADCECGVAETVKHEANYYPFALGRTAIGSPAEARRISAALAREALSVGLNMLHQPVVDVNTNPNNPIIGVRSPSDDPEEVAKFGKAQLEGAQGENLITVAKHYPGHGDTSLDSHLDLPVVDYERQTLEEIHLKPFQALIDAGLDAVMTSHIVVSCIDEEPATLSYPLLTGLLREKQGFDGMIVTDAMTMKAITDNYGVREAAVKATQAGADLILASGDFDFQQKTREGLIQAVRDGSIKEERIAKSAERVLKIKKRRGLLEDLEEEKRKKPEPLSALETMAENYALSQEAYGKSYTLLGDKDLLPLKADSSLLVTGPKEVNTIGSQLRRNFERVLTYPIDSADSDGGWSPSKEDIGNALKLVEGVNTGIVTTFSGEGDLPQGQRLLVTALAEKLPLVVVSLGLPYDYRYFEPLEGTEMAFLATYLQNGRGKPSPLPEAAGRALASVLKGDFIPQGGLPIQLEVE